MAETGQGAWTSSDAQKEQAPKEAQDYASQLFPFADGGERRITDHSYAIQHADQPTDDPQKLTKKWTDYLYAPDIDSEMRRALIRDTANRSWSHHNISGCGPTAIQRLVAARAHPEPWNSKYYDGQRYQGLETKRKASSKKGGDKIHDDAEEAWRKDEAFSHKGPPKKTVPAERHRLKRSEAAAVQIAEGAVRLATLPEQDADKDRFRRRPRVKVRGVRDCWICGRDLMDCGQDVDDHEHGGGRRYAPCGNTDNTGVVTVMDSVRGQGTQRKHTRLFGQSLFVLMKRPGPYPRKAVAIADEARLVARAATWTTKAAVLNSKSALEERCDRLKRKEREAERRSPKKRKVPPARIIRDDDGVAHAAPPPPGPGPDEFDEALAEAKRAVGALARFADDSRATSARAELLNALTGFGI